MVFAGGRRLLYFSVVLLLIFSLLQIWVCWHSCQVGAIRIFPTNGGPKVKLSHGVLDKQRKKDLFHKYFTGRTFGPNRNKTTEKGFKDAKRRVPSCPDPLHN